VPESLVVAAGREPCERREEHSGHGHGEHALGEDVQAEGGVDRARGLVLVDEARGEERVDERVQVDEPEAERDRHHELEGAADGRVAPVQHHVEAAVAAA
jgi:hypothetical protein